MGLARWDTHLILNARRAERLESVAEEVRNASEDASADVVAGDICDADLRGWLVDKARELGGLDILINNAGVGGYGRFDAADEARLRRIFEVNFFAAAELTRGCLPLLKESAAVGRRPLVVNVSSVLGHRAAPLKSEYSASKFALHGLTDALRAELARDGIGALLVSPSATATEFSESVVGGGERPPTYGRPASPEKVARKTLAAMRSGRHEILIGAGARWLVLLDRLAPWLADRLVAKFGMRD